MCQVFSFAACLLSECEKVTVLYISRWVSCARLMVVCTLNILAGCTMISGRNASKNIQEELNIATDKHALNPSTTGLCSRSTHVLPGKLDLVLFTRVPNLTMPLAMQLPPLTIFALQICPIEATNPVKSSSSLNLQEQRLFLLDAQSRGAGLAVVGFAHPSFCRHL